MSNQQRRLAAISSQLNASQNKKNSMTRSAINLDQNWVFKQSGPDAKVPNFLPTARFPTDVYSDLLHHAIIPDPFRGMNEQDVQWVSEKTWVYRTSFNTPKSVLTARKAFLIFEGLDTFAKVKLNDVEILRTDNMFIKYDIDVKEFLQLTADNILEIIFENPVDEADEVMRRLPNHKWGTMGGDPKRTAVRKAQYHFVRLPKNDQSTLLRADLGLGLGTATHNMWPLEAHKIGNI
jgi:beta-mannosidase